MDKVELLKKEFKNDWYVQAGSAVPIFICLAGMSGFTMKKELGFGYSRFIYNARKGHGEMWYLQSDLKNLWEIIKRELKKNPQYLKQIKKKYENDFKKYEKVFSKIRNSNLRGISDDELMGFFRNCALAMTDSVGPAHILEPVGLMVEKEFEAELAKVIFDNAEFRQAQAALIALKEMSFTSREEADLKKIAALPFEEKKKVLDKHSQKYFWVHNSYAGQKKININYFSKRLKELEKTTPRKQINPLASENLVKKYKLGNRIHEMSALIKLTTIWQDERKANALKTIGYLEKILTEISRRAKTNKDFFYYLVPSEISRLSSLEEVKALGKNLANRPDGVFLILRGDGETIASGQDYNKLVNFRRKVDEDKSDEDKSNETREISGSIANGGKVVGRVVVCKNINSIDKVKKGDILVASMTRPEYMPALRKAAAIVTDEGGITSHAAIVARELNIPAIIGTKNATQVLHDGQIVEVDADKGVVRILRKA